MPGVIRECTAADLPALHVLYQQLQPEDTTTLEDTRRGFTEMNAFPGCRVFVVEFESRLLGSFTLYILPNMTRNGRKATILENIIVDKAFRGQGLGRMMLEYAREEALAAGCYKLSLTTNAKRTDAHAFYRRCGMVHHGVSFRYEL